MEGEKTVVADERILVCLRQSNIDTSNFGNDEFENGKPFFDWFWENVLGLDSEEYRRRFWREVYTTGHTIGHVPRGLNDFMNEHGFIGSARSSALFMVLCLMGCSFAFWVVRRQLTLVLRRMRRSSYYERERERRRELAKARRAITVRRTSNPCPTAEELREAFAHAAESPEASLRFGSMLQDLECYVDSRVVVDSATGTIRGRRGGIKRFLQREVPEIFIRYKTAMSHKARAKRFRQACDAIDPIPIDALLPIHRLSSAVQKRVFRGMEFPERPDLRTASTLTHWMASNGNTAYLKTQDWVRAPVCWYSEDSVLRDDSQDLAAEILSSCRGTLISLDAAIALKIDPRLVREDVEPDNRVKVLTYGLSSEDFKKTNSAKKRILYASRRVMAWLKRFRNDIPAA